MKLAQSAGDDIYSSILNSLNNHPPAEEAKRILHTMGVILDPCISWGGFPCSSFRRSPGLSGFESVSGDHRHRHAR